MRVMFATCNKHLPEGRGGLEQTTNALALRLIARGHEVVCVSGLAGAGWLGFKAKIQLRILRKAYARDDVLGYPTFRSYAPLDSFGRLIDRLTPDVVVIQGHLHSNLMDIAIRAGKPVVMYYRSANVHTLSKDQLAHLSRIQFVANSRFTASLCPGRTVPVIRSIVCPENYIVQNNTREFITLVNPSPHKGVMVVAAVAERRPDLAFLFLRTQKYRNTIGPEQRLPGNITVIGPVDDMPQIYGRTRLVFAPSQCQESWGRVATEAQLSGIPVLASDRGGLPEAVGDGGLCVPATAEVDRWLDALDMIIGNEESYRRFSEAAVRHSRREEIDPAFILRQFEQILEDSCHGQREGWVSS